MRKTRRTFYLMALLGSAPVFATPAEPSTPGNDTGVLEVLSRSDTHEELRRGVVVEQFHINESPHDRSGHFALITGTADLGELHFSLGTEAKVLRAPGMPGQRARWHIEFYQETYPYPSKLLSRENDTVTSQTLLSIRKNGVLVYDAARCHLHGTAMKLEPVPTRYFPPGITICILDTFSSKDIERLYPHAGQPIITRHKTIEVRHRLVCPQCHAVYQGLLKQGDKRGNG